MPLYDEDEVRKQAARTADRSNRPDWRELDRRKDRSSHAPSERTASTAPSGTRAAYLQQRASAQARSDAEALFSNPAKDQALSALQNAIGSDAVQEAVDAYRAAYDELPADPEALVRALQHPDGDIQLEALDMLEELVPVLEGSTRETTLRGLSIFRMSARNMKARKRAARIVKRNPL